MWEILTIIASISLIVSFFRRKNAVWGGATIGLIIGTIVAIFQRFNWLVLYKAIIIGILVGVIADILGLLSDFLKKKS